MEFDCNDREEQATNLRVNPSGQDFNRQQNYQVANNGPPIITNNPNQPNFPQNGNQRQNNNYQTQNNNETRS